MDYFSEHPWDVANFEQMKTYNYSPNMPSQPSFSLQDGSSSGRLIDKEMIYENCFIGTFLHGQIKMFTEKIVPNFEPSEEVIQKYAEHLAVD